MLPGATESNLAVVVGGFVNGLGIVRALAALNFRIIVITTKPYDIAQHSKYVSEHLHITELEERPELLVELLIRHAEVWLGAIVFPTNDEAMASLSSSEELLSQWFQIIVPPSDSVPYVLDKNLMLQAAGEVGMLTPHCYGPAIDSTALKPDLTYPVVVKPVKASQFSSKFGKKLFLARNQHEMLTCTRLLAETNITGQVFDLIPGPDSRIYAFCVYMDRHGSPLAECTVHKLRQSPSSFGIARLAELVDNIQVLREQTIELLRHIGFRGIAVAEFKLDHRDESFRFIEINGRSVVYNTLLRCGTMDLVKLAWSDYVEGCAKRVKSTPWNGVWVHLHADVLRSTLDRHSEELTIRDYLKPYGRRKTYAVWSSRDPKPFFTQWFRTARKATIYRAGDH